MNASVLSSVEAVAAIARLAVTRATRSRSLWVALGLSLLPTLYAIGHRIAGHDPSAHWARALGTCTLLIAVIPPILVASSIADDIDDKTSAYLWSRPLARWTIVIGKLIGLAPFVVLCTSLAVTISWVALGPGLVPVDAFARGLAALAAGALAASAIAAGIATLAPRFAVATAVCWLLLIDLPVGGLDVGLHVIATSFGARALAGVGNGDPVTGAISLVVLTALGLGVALWRTERIE